MIYAINVSDVSKALVKMFTDDMSIGQEGTRIERSENFETPDDVKGYVGVYRDRQNFTPRTLGAGAGYRQQSISFIILLRESGYASGAECEDALEILVAHVMRVILNDETLLGTVDMIGENIDVRYDKYDQDGGLYKQTAGLYFAAITNVRKT